MVCVGPTTQPRKTNCYRSINNKPKSIYLGQIGPFSRGRMMLCNESRKEAAGLIPFLTPRKEVRIGTWNTRKMYEAGRTRQVEDAIKRYNICLLGLSEIRWLQSGQIRLNTGETLLYSGHEEGNPSHRRCRTDAIPGGTESSY